jgi:histidyl-tRNA synthetase
VRDVTDIGVALEMLSPESPPQDVQEVLGILKGRGIGNAAFDPSIVRGFNYYTGVVFEVFDTHPENNRSVFGGGRYDSLTNLFDDEAVAGVGCAAGDAALRDFLEVRNLLPAYLPPTKVYIAVTSPKHAEKAAEIADELRKENIPVAIDFGEKKLGDQLKAASKHKIPYVMVVGEDELASGTFTVRDLMSGDEKSLSREELSHFFLSL